MTLSFRICTASDLDLADPPFVAAYGFTGSRKALLYQYWLLQPDGWWLVSLDEKPVGFGGAIDYGPFSYVGMLGIHPSVQRHGIGEALVRQILAWGDAHGCPTFLLNAKEQAVPLYRRSGFIEEAAVFRFTQNELVSLPKPSLDVYPLQASDILDIAAFDAPYFGANRANVLHSHLAQKPGSAFVSRGEMGQITGYIFVQSGSLGPWVAQSVETAEHLLIHALSHTFERCPSVTLPSSNDEGQYLLKCYGFRQQGMNSSMRRGAPTPFRQLSKLYGEASPALG